MSQNDGGRVTRAGVSPVCSGFLAQTGESAGQDPSTIVRIIRANPLHLKITRPGKYRIITRYFATDSVPLQLEDKIEICSSGVEIDYDCFGVLTAGAEKSLKFTLDFKAGATDSVGHEREEVLLLGAPKQNLSSPIILCSDPTVSGSHGVTLGEMPERELDYLRSRGLSEKAAKELIIRSRFAEAFKLAKLEQNWDNSLEEQFEEMLKETLR